MRTNATTNIAILSLIIALAIICRCVVPTRMGDGGGHSVERHTDTVIICKTIYDTVVVTKPEYIERVVSDTVYIDASGGGQVSLPVVRKHYRGEALYDIWVSGIEPLRLDSVKIYREGEMTERISYVDRVEYREVREPLFSLYVSGGFYSIYGDFVPNVGISAMIGRKWLISADLGVGVDVFGIGINYKIF